ncbi:MFS transporter, partial [Saccharothrix sp. MB29]|nr:MFS transporter [Saccharothrix sp. MB29]
MAASLATALVAFDSTASIATLPGIGVELDADFTAQQWVVVAHVLPLAVLLLVAGALVDRVGRRRAFCAGVVLFVSGSVSGSVAAGAAGALPMLIAARGGQGVGSALLLSAAAALVAQEFPGEDRGAVLGTAAATGLALGLVAGNVLAEVDWRLVFLAVLPTGTMLLAVGTVRLRDVRPSAAPPLDRFGFAAFGTCATLLVLGLMRGESLGWTSTSVLVMFAGAALSLVVFLLAERARGDKAAVRLALFGNRAFFALCLAALLTGAIGLAGVFLSVLHLRNTLGHSPAETALRLLPLALALVTTAAA